MRTQVGAHMRIQDNHRSGTHAHTGRPQTWHTCAYRTRHTCAHRSGHTCAYRSGHTCAYRTWHTCTYRTWHIRKDRGHVYIQDIPARHHHQNIKQYTERTHRSYASYAWFPVGGVWLRVPVGACSCLVSGCVSSRCLVRKRLPTRGHPRQGYTLGIGCPGLGGALGGAHGAAMMLKVEPM